MKRRPETDGLVSSAATYFICIYQRHLGGIIRQEIAQMNCTRRVAAMQTEGAVTRSLWLAGTMEPCNYCINEPLLFCYIHTCSSSQKVNPSVNVLCARESCRSGTLTDSRGGFSLRRHTVSGPEWRGVFEPRPFLSKKCVYRLSYLL